jgi:aspartate aminotransferase-like enzyme
LKVLKRRKIMMLPGPNEPYPEILGSLNQMVLPHYGDDWVEEYQETCEGMKKIFMTSDSEVMVWPGSGASAADLVAANLVDEGDRVINVKNGFFGESFENKIKSYGGKVISVESDFGKAIPPDDVRKAVEENPDAKTIFVVQNETSSCTLNPVKAIGEISRDTGKILVVDAISAIGATELRMDEWGIDVCLGYASKSLGSLGMVSPIAFNERSEEMAERRKDEIKPYFRSFIPWKGPSRAVTMPTLNILALKMAIHLALKEGLENRFKRHSTAAKATREGVRAIGLEVLPEEEEAADAVTAVLVPEGIQNEIRGLLMEDHNIMVGGSLGKWGRDKLLRIGHMGVTASPEYVIPTLYALEQVMKKLGENVSEGSAVDAAMEIYKKRPFEWVNALLARYDRKTLPKF